jgi:hypothetical protein
LLSTEPEEIDLLGTSRLRIFDVLAAAITEGLQYLQIIPPDEDAVIQETGKELGRCRKEKIGLEKLLQIVRKRI